MRVMSYNIHRGVGARDGMYRPRRVIDVIEAHNPDIVCLQEVALKTKQVSYDDQPAMIARELHFEHAIFQGNRHLKEGVWGNMLLSRWPITQSHRISLTLKWRKAQGGDSGRRRNARGAAARRQLAPGIIGPRKVVADAAPAGTSAIWRGRSSADADHRRFERLAEPPVDRDSVGPPLRTAHSADVAIPHVSFDIADRVSGQGLLPRKDSHQGVQRGA